jgi:Uma2 family endonuclease
MNARQEWLLEQWDAACRDPELARLPHKVELNERGKIELTPPAPPIHGSFAFDIATLLERALGGKASVECPVLTTIGVRVPDAVWLPDARRRELRSAKPLLQAPSICVEVLSLTNTEQELADKTRAYLEAGAEEVIWVDPQQRRVRFFHAGGEAAQSRFSLLFDQLFD